MFPVLFLASDNDLESACDDIGMDRWLLGQKAGHGDTNLLWLESSATEASRTTPYHGVHWARSSC